MDAEVPLLLALPSELIHHILSHLDLSDLLSVGLVNRALNDHSAQDTLWQPFVQAQIPASTVSKPANQTWRALFKQHHPYWFLAKRKIWFADIAHTGKLLIARYDHRINAIEAYALVAERRQPTFQTWDYNPDAIIHTFSPRVQLDLNAPVLRLNAESYEHATGDIGHRLQKEIPMNVFDGTLRSSVGIYSRLLLTRPWPQSITTEATPVWPPLTLPSTERTRNDAPPSGYRQASSKPATLDQLSTSTFRLRKWMEFAPRPHGVSMRIGEDISTWATLPEECYTPTPQKPWQGIWCGDYAGHGCEFLAIMQPDDPRPLPERAEWALRARERDGSVSSAGSWSTAPTDAALSGDEDEPQTADDLEDSVATLQAALHERDSISTANDLAEEDETVYQGRIEAVKLTGDPNIPRGQYTFIAPDIGPSGLLRVATEDIFKGARIVKSVGHIAANGFRDDNYMTSQLILISHDRLAQYWETFGHVSFYQRVDIDAFTRV
ncbi:Nn.00g032560.m01.CDS01 [Neocucurbitaria sp. VM-36]